MASTSSRGFDGIFNAGPGFVSDDYQTARVQGVSPFSFFNVAPEPFSGDMGAGGGLGSFARSPDLGPMPSFDQIFNPVGPAGVSDISVNVPPIFPSSPDVFVEPFMPGVVPAQAIGVNETQPVPGTVPGSNNSSLFPVPAFGRDGVSSVSENGVASLNSGVDKDPGVGADVSFPGFLGLGGESGSVSTEDNKASEVMESDLKANKMLFRTFDEPEKSDFGKFLDNQITGGPGNQGKSEGKGILSAIFEGFLLAGLLFALPFIVKNVIPFIKDDLIPFIKGPFLDFVKAAGGFLGKAWDHMGPIVVGVLTAVGGWLTDNGDAIWGAVAKAVTAVGRWLTTSVWPAIEKAAGAIGGWLKDNGGAVWTAIGDAARAIGGWVEKTVWPEFASAMTSFGKFITETLWPFFKEVGAPVFISSLVNTFGVVGDLFHTLGGNMGVGDFLKSLLTRAGNASNLASSGRGATVSGVLGGTGEDDFWYRRSVINSQGMAIVARHNAGLELGSRFYLDPETGKMYRVRKEVDRGGFSSAIGDYDPLFSTWGSVKDASLLSGYADVVGTVEALKPNASVGSVGGLSTETGETGKVESASGSKVEGVEDAVITSEGHVIHTDPEDSIYAFKGDVSIEPANRTREFSGSPVAYSSQQSSVTNSVTNNYNVSQSNFNWPDLLPGSEFDPVGV
jgi:hypothetical protein